MPGMDLMLSKHCNEDHQPHNSPASVSKYDLISLKSIRRQVSILTGHPSAGRVGRSQWTTPSVLSLVNWLYLLISLYLSTTFVISARLLSMSLSPRCIASDLLTTASNYTGLESEHPNLYSSAIFIALKYSTICWSFNKSPGWWTNSTNLQPENTIPRMSLKTTQVSALLWSPHASLDSCHNQLCHVQDRVTTFQSLLSRPSQREELTNNRTPLWVWERSECQFLFLITACNSIPG